MPAHILAFRYKKYTARRKPYMKGRMMPELWNDDWHDKYVNEKYRKPRQRRATIKLSCVLLLALALCFTFMVYPTQWLFVAAGAIGIYALVLAHRYDMER